MWVRCIRTVIIGQIIERAIYIEIPVVTDEHPGPAGHSADDDCALIVPVHRLNDTLALQIVRRKLFRPTHFRSPARGEGRALLSDRVNRHNSSVQFVYPDHVPCIHLSASQVSC